MKTKVYSIRTKITAFVCVLLMLTFTCQESMAWYPNPNSQPPPHQDLVGVICVIIIGAVILGVGGCAAKKLLEHPIKRQDPTGELDPQPPTPPGATNNPAPPRTPNGSHLTVSSLDSTNDVAIWVNANAGDPANCGMVSWHLSDAYAADGSTPYTNSATGAKFTHVITTTILGSTDLAAPVEQWQPVGGRIIWYSNPNDSSGYHGDGSMVVVFYDAHGIPSATNAYTASDYAFGQYGAVSSDSDSKIQLMDWERGTNCFFRLASPTNRIGVLTAP